jgi:thymidylate synthase (FAD)
MTDNTNKDFLGDSISNISVVQHVGSDQMIVMCARTSYANDQKQFTTKKDTKLIKYLLKHDHGTPFESNLITFRIVAPIFLLRQLMRYRIASFNEQSARYTEVKEEAYFPITWRKQALVNKQASEGELSLPDSVAVDYLAGRAWDLCFSTYKELLSIGVAREQARMYLPLATYSTVYMTLNLRSLFNVLEQRLGSGAQQEAQMLAKSMLELVEPLFPVTFSAWKELKGVV